MAEPVKSERLTVTVVSESLTASWVTTKLMVSPSITPAASASATAMETAGVASLSMISPVADAVPMVAPVSLSTLVMVAVKSSGVGSSSLSSKVVTSTVKVALSEPAGMVTVYVLASV